MFLDFVPEKFPEDWFFAVAVKDDRIIVGREAFVRMPDRAGTGKAVRWGHIGGSPDMDLVLTCENAGEDQSGVWWYSLGVSPQWHDISGPEGIKFDRIELLDLDDDGDLDVITCEERENLGVIWYENPAR